MNQKEFDQKIQYFNNSMPETCPIIHSMQILGSKWKVPILWYLMLQDGQHYNELKRTVDSITNTMLTRSLRELEEDGLIYRHDYETVPPSVSYHLTELGKTLIGTMGELFEWGKKHLEQTKQQSDSLSN